MASKKAVTMDDIGGKVPSAAEAAKYDKEMAPRIKAQKESAARVAQRASIDAKAKAAAAPKPTAFDKARANIKNNLRTRKQVMDEFNK